MRATRMGIVGTRLAGTDGVSLEVGKWVSVLEGLGHELFFFAGESEWPTDRSMVVPEAHFSHPEVEAIQADLFDDGVRSEQTSERVHRLRRHLKAGLQRFVARFGVEILIVENALSIPMNVPLGLAITEYVAETNMPVIAHHHDFAWERHRFAVNGVSDFLRAAFPPVLASVQHVVINSYAARQLAIRTGQASFLVPNVMHFEAPPPKADETAAELLTVLGVGRNEAMILQPTRIVPRKRIERAIELVRRLEMPASLVISHAAGDEGDEYADYLARYAEMLGVRVLFAAQRVGHSRGVTPSGETVFSLADAYQAADLVTYPSNVEGFGNAFLEAIYYCRPIVLRAYDIFEIDIRPKGFRVLAFGEYMPESLVEATRDLLRSPDRVAEMAEHNYAIGRKYYSYAALESCLSVLLTQALGM